MDPDVSSRMTISLGDAADLMYQSRIRESYRSAEEEEEGASGTRIGRVGRRSGN